MDNLFILILLGAVLFFMFRKSGVKCYGSHGHVPRGNYYFDSSGHIHMDDDKTHERQPEIIDLSKDENRVLPDDEK